MNVYLVRHGQKKSYPGDPGLTDVGVQQAIETGRFLKQFPINKIISSPFKRTKETANYIAEILGISFELRDELVERMNWTGEATREEFVDEWVRATRERDYVPRFGDSSRVTGGRVVACIDSVLVDSKNLVVVSHGGAIIDYLRNIFDDEVLDGLKKTYVNGEGFEMLNCAVTKVSFVGKPTIGVLNFVGHLSERSE